METYINTKSIDTADNLMYNLQGYTIYRVPIVRVLDKTYIS